jgi:hypothetical protein
LALFVPRYAVDVGVELVAAKRRKGFWKLRFSFTIYDRFGTLYACLQTDFYIPAQSF